MNAANSQDRSFGHTLYAAGWRQGVLFDAPSASFLFNTRASGSSSVLIWSKRDLKAKEKLVLVTQDCDIIASSAEEPYVEAMLCKSVTSTRASKVDRNSARYFLVDPSANLVAEARYRIAIDKTALPSFAPQPWPSNEERLERFVRWLARRYDRPAIPDALFEVFQRPLEEALVQLDAASPHVGTAFSRAIQEVRISLPERDEPPFDLHMIFLIRKDALNEEEADALFAVSDAIQAHLDPAQVVLDPNTRMVTSEEISMAEYFASRPLFLEYLTYRGEEVDGAKPPARG